MGRHLHYKPGSFYRTDDRTGFPQRAERTRREWNNLIVDEARWEPRQPQDLVRGVPDRQSVPEARPLAPNVFVGPVYTTITQAIGPASVYVIPLASTMYVQAGENVAFVQNDGSLWHAVVLGLDDFGNVVIDRAAPLGAQNGASFIDYRTQGTPLYVALATEDGRILLTEAGAPIAI